MQEKVLKNVKKGMPVLILDIRVLIVAIVGIVIGAVAVIGLGGFSIFWFVIKKKSFSDLIKKN